MLSMNSVTIASPGRVPRLHALSLSVRPGEFLAVLGPNGAGKSTLVGVLAGSLPLSAGAVTLEGRALGSYPLPDLARRRAVLTQDTALAVDLCRRQDIGVLAVLHGANLAALYADRVAIVQRGRVQRIGAPTRVLSESMFQGVFTLRVDVRPHPHHAHRPLIIVGRAFETHRPPMTESGELPRPMPVMTPVEQPLDGMRPSLLLIPLAVTILMFMLFLAG